MLFTTTILAALAAAPALALPTIEAKGSKFFTSDGDQWYIKGVAYQLTPDDPLAQGDQCQLDASLMKTLGANAIRVYHVDPAADHDACMSAFSDAGIYVFLDLDTFSTYVLPDNPSWNDTQLQAYSKVMDVFHNYDNVAGFFVGNEVLTTGANSIAAPYVKAAARDMKAYRDSKGYRNIPVGYSAADIAQLRPNLQNYLACGSNTSESLDFFSLNAYEWCGESTFQTSGYAELQKNASDYNIPIFFSETGCNQPSPRNFGDQSAILGPDMADTWSGAIVYEWIQEANEYGLITYNPSFDTDPANFAVSGTPTPRSPDFDNLKSQWATLSPTGVKAADYRPSLTPPPCPAFTSALWEVNRDVALPTLNQKFDAQVSSAIKSGGSAAAESTGDAASSASSSSSSSSGQRAVGVESLFYTVLSLVFLW
ncbi:glycoside hydrolase family 72 protein [Zasmidium cellare ATCC 36951]|uniref:1,3-beta-glucanosyltransferase n=1 Tax=Zasmidium cellare ATCC 36951 TaxID=1080233 RepID=A0A6A6CV29_ZASCE|nr:glycoside hydrolase family 72 protein [Zasmidium cellare ATCC 36951]KAF2170048.1 glycoside hydrolase family 72 protein [Zasmidium cellare ATCC 36951]